MPEVHAGLVESVKRLLSTLISIASTRLELLANELQEERLRLTQMIAAGLLALFCGGIGLLLLSGFIVMLFWDEHRLLALGLMSMFFLISGMVLSIYAWSKARRGSGLFSASLCELAEDKARLETGSRQSEQS